MKVGDYVYVIDWGKHYSKLTRWVDGKRENIFPVKVEIPQYSGIDFHWECIYEPNLTLKGTVNKREPTKLVSRKPIYKNYKWKIVEQFVHPTYTDRNLLLLVAFNSKKGDCYTVIEEAGVSELTPEQYADNQFNAVITANLGKWDRKKLLTMNDKKAIPAEILSVFYDKNDNVLFGSNYTKGLVTYNYLEGKFSTDGKPIYISCSVSYDGRGNDNCPNPELIKEFSYIKSYLEG